MAWIAFMRYGQISMTQDGWLSFESVGDGMESVFLGYGVVFGK